MHKILCATFCGKPVESVKSVENSKLRCRGQTARMAKIASATLAILAVEKKRKQEYDRLRREVIKMMTIKEVNAIFDKLRKILAMLDKIYHMLEGKE